MQVKQAIFEAANHLEKSKIPEPRLDAALLLEHLLGLSRSERLLIMDKPLSDTDYNMYQQFIHRRAAGEPVSHIIGKREFWGLEFDVSAQVLDPRPDSETLIEAVLQQFPSRKESLQILDIGTGSGCLILSLLSEFYTAMGDAIDISPEALEVAKSNAVKLGLANRVQFHLECLNTLREGLYDVIISNPPYIPSEMINTLQNEVKDFEPRLALDGGKDGLALYKQFAEGIIRLLKKDGYCFFEIGQGQEQEVISIMESRSIVFCRSFQDLNGVTRVLMFNKG